MRSACRIEHFSTRSRFGAHWISFLRNAMPFAAPLPESPLASVSDLLLRRAAERPHQPAFVFTSGEGPDAAGEVVWTFAELDSRARAVAASLAGRAAAGDRPGLVFPPGLGFLAAYFGCLYA
ncbi:MAG TPA: hypothetical protein PJ982_16330, partial [Lacipirellulaceae bacterium]|nr:hypothetical protein [Lacipirellulaceae bacterium]